MSKNPGNRWKLMKIANIDWEFLHIFWTTWKNSMKFSGKMCYKITLKVIKNQGFILSLQDTFFEKTTGREGGGVKLLPPPPLRPAVLGLKLKSLKYFARKVWSIVLFQIRNAICFEEFSAKIKSWRPENCPCRVCLTYIHHVGKWVIFNNLI